MEEEETELINLINSTWEEMAPSEEKGDLDRMEEGALPCQAATSSFPSHGLGQVSRGRGFCGPQGRPLAVDPVPSQYLGSTRDG